MSTSRHFQPHIERMAGYVPGEQPQVGGFTKLNTNENPYPPSPAVAEAIRSALGERLRLYPDPVGTAFREAAARLHGVGPDMILAGNGSDDLLTIVTRAFVGPGDPVICPTPSYILYRTLVQLQDGREAPVSYTPDWRLEPGSYAIPGARLAFLANPNSPSGTSLPPAEVAALADRLDCPLVVDEAYVDFAEEHCIGLVADHPNVIVLRTLSKGYSLAGLRLGYLIARPEVVAGLIKVKDSYNCDTLSLVGGAAALADRAHQDEARGKILATRRRLTEAVRALGYRVPDSQANFVWCTGGPPAAEVYAALKERKILVRLMRYPGIPDGLRITVGTDAEVDRLLEHLGPLVRGSDATRVE
jgi:histidinol-phosphate aminotransferase